MEQNFKKSVTRETQEGKKWDRFKRSIEGV